MIQKQGTWFSRFVWSVITITTLSLMGYGIYYSAIHEEPEKEKNYVEVINEFEE